MDGWVIKRLSEVCEKITDGTHQTPKYSDQGHIFLSSKNVTSGRIDWNNVRYIDDTQHVEMQKRISPRVGDILLAKNGTTGVAAMVDRDICFDIYVSLAFLRPLKFIEPKLLWYFINSPIAKEQFNKRLKGIGVPNLHLKEIREVQFPYPISPVEQKRIVSILDTVFADLEQTRARTEQNLKNARELFDSYLQQVFSQKGEGWVEKKLIDVCVLQRGFDLPTRLRTKGEYPLVSSSGITDSHIESKIKGPGVVTGRSGSIGNVFYINEDFWPLNTALYIKEFHGNNEKFVSWLLRDFDLSRFASGAGVPTLNRNFVHDELVNIPESIDEQVRLVKSIESLKSLVDEVITIYQKKLNAIDELKKSILQKAFSGELTNTVE